MMKNTRIVCSLVGLIALLLIGCNGDLPDSAVLVLEAAQDGYYYAIEIDGEFIGKILYSVSSEPDYVEQYVTIGDHTVVVAAYISAGDYFADNPVAFGPKEITLSVPPNGMSYMFTESFFLP